MTFYLHQSKSQSHQLTFKALYAMTSIFPLCFPLLLPSSFCSCCTDLLRHFKHAFTIGLLPLLFPLPFNTLFPDMLFSQRAMQPASSFPLIFLKCHLLSGDFSHALFKIAIQLPKSWSLSFHSTCYHLTYYMFNFFICSLCLKRKYKQIERRYLCLLGSLLCSCHLEKYLTLINIGKWINKWPPLPYPHKNTDF